MVKFKEAKQAVQTFKRGTQTTATDLFHYNIM